MADNDNRTDMSNTSSDDNNTKRKKKSRRKWIGLALILLVVLGIIVAVYFYWTHGKLYPSTEDAYVHGDIFSIAARVQGKLVVVAIIENQHVSKGQVIAELDPSDFDKRVASAAASLAESRATLATDQARIAEAKARVEAAQSRHELAQTNLKRFSDLYKRRSVPKQRYDDAVSAAKVAAADLAAAEKSVSAATADLAVAEQRVKVKEADLAQAQLQRSYATILTPVDGFVTKKSAEVGDVVAPGQPLCAVVPLSAGYIWVDANFKETDLHRIRVNQRVTFHTDVNPDRTYHGWVESISAGTGAAFALLPPENATGNWIKIVQRLPVRIAIEPADLVDHSLRLGLSTRVVVNTVAPPRQASPVPTPGSTSPSS
jgi:membrane fusion protein (multidrug efflux system)